MSTHRRLLQTFSVIVILSMMFSGFSLPVVSAQEGDGIERQVNAQTGKVSFIGPESGRVLSAAKALGISPSARPADPGMALAKRFGPEFGLKDPARDLTRLKTNLSANGRRMFRYQQNYEGVPVMGGELIVNTNGNGDLYSMNGEISPDLSLSTQPTVDSGQAQQAALEGAARWYRKAPEDFVASEPELWIFDESLLQPSTRPAELVWRMEVTAVDNSVAVRELVLVNAQNGRVSLHFNQIDTAWGEMGVDGGGTASSPRTAASRVTKTSAGLQMGNVHAKTYTGDNIRNIPPGRLVCDQIIGPSLPPCTSGSNEDEDANSAQAFAIDVYNFYLNNFGRNSINNNGMAIVSTVDYCDPDTREACPYDNAYWSGTQMVYGSSETYAQADDIVAHELTHGVTQYESNLFYYYQSGAINESFSDLWGEYYDQSNGQGSDAGYEWLIGEDVVGVYDGPFRNMSNPPAYGDPDRMSHGFYYTGTGDNGGVHYNSGINNKAVYLMVEGDASSGVTGIGWAKTAAIYYEVNTNMLTSGADYSDLYYALQQACSNLIGENGIIADDCMEVKDALDAVEMNLQPEEDFNTDVPECDSSDPPVTTIFYDDLESGTGNWTFSNGTYLRWQLDSPDYGSYAHSGIHSLYAKDRPVARTDASARLSPFIVPSGAYLHFAHAYEFHSDGSTYDDGGVLEYSINGGSTWLDARSLIEGDYPGTLAENIDNPLAGRPAFVGVSHGYISTRLDLASLAGQTVAFRWRMGLNQTTDSESYALGWWVDDVHVYQCVDMWSPTITSIVRAGSNPTSASSVAFTVTFSEPVQNVLTSDFTLDATGTISGATIANVSGIGATRTVTVNTGSGTGTLRLDVPGSTGITDLWDNPLTNLPYMSGEAYTISSMWYIRGQGSFGYGTENDTPVPADYNGDGKAEIAIFRPSNGTWYIHGIGSSVYGTVDDIPVVADYNGDGQDDIAVFRPTNSTWYIRGIGSFVYGTVGDIPVVADYTGDGKADIAVFRPSNSTWYIYGVGPRIYGTVGDIPAVADYNGDGRADIAVFRPTNSTWYIYGVGPSVYGMVDDIPVVGDYNGDGKADIAVFRPSNSTWYIRGVGPSVFGTVGDIPVVADYNGDGKADIAVFRP